MIFHRDVQISIIFWQAQAHQMLSVGYIFANLSFLFQESIFHLKKIVSLCCLNSKRDKPREGGDLILSQKRQRLYIDIVSQPSKLINNAPVMNRKAAKLQL